jgi:excisionase family DNA binding protein
LINPTVTIMRASTLAGVSRRTIYKWLATGKLEYVRTAGGNVRILRTSLFKDGNVPVGALPPELTDG